MLDPAIEKNIQRWQKYKNRIESVFSEDQMAKSLEDAVSELFHSYIPWTWAIVARKAYNFSGGLKEEPLYVATILSAVNYKMPQTVRKIILYALYRFDKAIKEEDNNEVKRSVLFLVACYRQKIIHVTLMSSIIVILFRQKRRYFQLIISIMWLIAPLINDDSKSDLTLLFQELHRYSESEFSNQIFNLTKWRREGWVSYTGPDRHTYSRVPIRFHLIEDSELKTIDDIDIDEDTPNEDLTLPYLDPYDLEKFNQFHDEYKNDLKMLVEEEEEEPDSTSTIPLPNSSIELENKDVIQKSLQEKEIYECKREVYLTIVSSGTCGEAAHKMIKMLEKKGEQYRSVIMEMCIDYISNEISFDRTNGVMIQMMVGADQYFLPIIEEYFIKEYSNSHKYDTRKIHSLASLYSFLFANNVISWRLFGAIRLTLEETSSSHRVFIRSLLEELAKEMSNQGLLRKMNEPDVLEYTKNLFLSDTLEHAEFVSEFFSAIKLDFLCERVRNELAKFVQERARIESISIENVEKNNGEKRRRKHRHHKTQ